MKKLEKYRTSINGKATPTYISYNSMKQRCCYPKHKKYSFYGGSGIFVCDRWLHSFSNFIDDMGERPEGTSLDRIDPSKGYEPVNCRWVTNDIQQSNKKNKRTVIYEGDEVTVSELSRRLNIPFYNVYKWVWKGRDINFMAERYRKGERLHDWTDIKRQI